VHSEIFHINYGKSSQADEINTLTCTTRLMVSVSGYAAGGSRNL
jgi:hypothetical protein